MQSSRQPSRIPIDPAIQFSLAPDAIPTFKEQGESFLLRLASRKHKPVHESTIFTWKHNLNHWIYPAIGELQLSEVSNATIKPLIAAMVAEGLKASYVNAMFRLIVTIVASYLDGQGEPVYSRQWNPDFLDLPLIIPRELNRPCFNGDIVSKLACWRYPRAQMIFILAASSGARISELLGLDIRQHISWDFSTLRIARQAIHGRLVEYVKTQASYREIDRHSSVSTMLKHFIGTRESGLLFCSRKGTPIYLNGILDVHLHPALHEYGYVNSCTGTHLAGMHAFRRFRNTLLGSCPGLPDRLRMYWMGHRAGTMIEKYDQVMMDRAFRRMWAERCGIGFALPPA